MRNKLGFHVNRPGDDIFEAIKRIKPRVIKTLEHDKGLWTRVREVHPDVYLIGRRFKENQRDFIADPQSAGHRLADEILGFEVNRVEVNGRRLFDAWESYNEVIFNDTNPDEKRKYDEFQVVFGERLKAEGFDPIGMNFSTGTGSGEDFLEHFAGTLETYDYIGFHEYDWPVMWRLHEENIIEKGEEGMWLCLRYRRTMRDVRKKYPNKHTVIITECGMTQGVFGAQNGAGDKGPWHSPTTPPDFTRKLEETHGLDLANGVSVDSYWDSLMWYNHELLQDDYVKGACLFVIGYEHPKWKSFDHLGPIIDRLDDFQQDRMPPPQIHVVPGTEVKPVGGKKVIKSPAERDSLEMMFLAEGSKRQVIRFNPEAALQKKIFNDGFVPNSEEFEAVSGDTTYLAQQAEHLDTGSVRVYYVASGDWGNVRFVQKT